MHAGFWWENLKDVGHLEEPVINGRIILKWILGNGVVSCEGMDWMDLARDREWWRAL